MNKIEKKISVKRNMLSVDDYKKLLKTQTSHLGLPLSESSINNYTQKIKYLFSKGYGQLLNTPGKLLNKLNDDYKQVISRKSSLMAIIKYLKVTNISSEKILEELNNAYMEMSKDYEEERKDKNSTIEDDYLDYTSLLKLKSKIKNDLQFLTLFKIYTENPPLRNDVYNLKFKNYTDKDNYYDKKSKKIVINEYKESKLHGPIILDNLSVQLLKNLNSLIKLRKDEYVFHNLEDKPFTDTKNFSNYFKRKFYKISGKSIGTTVLRKIYIDWLEKQNLSEDERNSIYHKMGCKKCK